METRHNTLLDIETLTTGTAPRADAALPFTPVPPSPARPPSTPPSAVATPFSAVPAYPAPSYLQLGGGPQSGGQRVLSHAAQAAQGGAVVASDAAADPALPRASTLEPRVPAAHTPARSEELLELLWAADDLAVRAGQSDRRELVPVDGVPATDESRRVKECARMLGRPDALADQRSLESAWLESMREGGGLLPALVIVTGELEVALHPATFLQALIGVIEPLAMGNAPIAEALESARAASKSSWLSSRSIEDIVSKLGDTVSRSRRELSFPRIEASARRLVLERRAFDKRALLGAEHLRATLHFGSNDAGVVMYLPLALEARLPLFERLPVRAAVELHPSQDALESQSFALLTCGLARRLLHRHGSPS